MKFMMDTEVPTYSTFRHGQVLAPIADGCINDAGRHTQHDFLETMYLRERYLPAVLQCRALNTGYIIPNSISALT